MRSFLLMVLRCNIRYKLRVGRRKGYVGKDIKKECKAVADLNLKYCNMDELEDHGIVYKKDLLWGKLQWDYQFDSIAVINRGGADCNSIHRMVQCFLTNKGKKAYLVSFITKPFSKSHATCIYKEGGKYHSADYGRIVGPFVDIKSAVLHTANRYSAEPVCYVVQDLKWNVVQSGTFRDSQVVTKDLEEIFDSEED